MKVAAVLAVLGAASATAASRRRHEPSTHLAGRAAGSVLVKTYGTAYAAYMVNATAGTPPQDFALLVATSSPYTWVPEAAGYYCSDPFARARYCGWGSFVRNASSTFQQNASEKVFYASAVDESRASGEWISDAFALEGVALSRLSMGLADDANRALGALGLGFNDSTHDGVVDAMMKQGLIASSGYSLWLDGEDAESGNVLFGAVDTAKFSGSLRRVPAYKYSPLNRNVGISLYSVNATLKDGGDSFDFTSPAFPMTMALSHANPLSNFPTAVASQIWALGGATYDSLSRTAVIPCSAARDLSAGTINLQFEGPGGPGLRLPLSDLVLSAEATEELGWSSDAFGNDTQWCLFGVQNSTHAWSTAPSLTYSLGSSLLRRAYTAVDLVNQQVAVAPVAFGAKESTVVAFEQYGARIPRSEIYCLDGFSCETSLSGPNDGWPDDRGQMVNSRGWPRAVVAAGAILGALVILSAVAATLLLTRKGYCGRERKSVKGKEVETPPALAPMSMLSVPRGGVAPQTQPAFAARPGVTTDINNTPDVRTGPAGGRGDWPLAQDVAGGGHLSREGPPEPDVAPVSPVSTVEEEQPRRNHT